MLSNEHESIKSFVIAFLRELQSKEFAIGVDSFVETLAITDKFLTEHPLGQLRDLRSYLSPMICRNSPEQKEFSYLFDQLLLARYGQAVDQQIVSLERQVNEMGFKVKTIRRIKWIFVSILFLLILSGAYVTILRNDIFALFGPRVNLVKKPVQFKNVGDYHTKDIAEIIADPADTQKLEVHQYLKGQGQEGRRFGQLFFLNKIGIDTLVTTVSSKKYRISAETAEVLFIGPRADIAIRTESRIAYVNKPVLYSLVKRDTLRLPYAWYVNDSVIPLSENKDSFKYNFSDTGLFRIAVRYETDSFLSRFPVTFYSASVEQEVRNDVVEIAVSAIPLSPKSGYEINPWWIFILSAVALAGIFFIWWLSKKIRQIRRLKFQMETFLPESPDGHQPPGAIPYKPVDDLLLEHPLLRKISGYLIKTIETRIRKLDLKKTIRSTIKNAELETPVFTNKKTTAYYLVLVDKEYANSQQFKLFTYLIRYFVRRSVEIDFYYYNQFPETVFKVGESEGISLYELSNAYNDATLLVFSSGHSFIGFNKQVIRPQYSTLFRFWEQRILITPLPFLDWGNQESVLNTLFNIVPADITGLLEITHLLQEQPEINNIFSRKSLSTYEARFVDFEAIESLKEYLDHDEDLIQWLCALAVNPKITWEVTIEIGKVILGPRQYKINYENLLRFARIKWINEGRFTAPVRLMLLKNLKVKNELRSRAALLKMLDEIKVDPASFSYEEKKSLQYNNSFILFAAGNNNKSVYSSLYDNEDEIRINAEKFITLYKAGRLSDVALKLYILKKGSGGQTGVGDWETPIMYDDDNVNVDEFIRRTEDRKADVYQQGQRHKIARIKYSIYAIGSVLGLVALLLWAVLFSKEDVYDKPFNRTLGLVGITELTSDSSFLNLVAPCAGVAGYETRESVRYSVFKNNLSIDSGYLMSADTVRIPFRSDADPIDLAITINKITYLRRVNTVRNTNYYFNLQSPACFYNRDSVFVHMAPGGEVALQGLKDTLESLGNYVSMLSDYPDVVDQGPGPYNTVGYYGSANRNRAMVLQNIATTYLRTKVELQTMDAPRAPGNALHLWVYVGDIADSKGLDTLLIRICKPEDRSAAETFRNDINRRNIVHSASINLQPGACSNEVWYYDASDIQKAQELASEAGSFLNQKFTVRSGVLSPENTKNKMELRISLPPRPKILWVDDYPEKNNGNDILYFRANNIDVDVARTNFEAFEKLNTTVYSYIITDIGRTNPEKCVIDKDIAGVEFLERVNFPKDFTIVCSPPETIRNNKLKISSAGVPETNLMSDKNLLRQTILKGAANGNKRIFTQSIDCPEECHPYQNTQGYVLFYSKTGNELNASSQTGFSEIIRLIRNGSISSARINTYAYSAGSASANKALSEKNANAISNLIAKLGMKILVDANGNGSIRPLDDNTCDRLEINLFSNDPPSSATDKIIFDTLRDTYLGYKNSLTGKFYENIPLQELGIVLTLAKEPGKTVVFRFDIDNGACPKGFSGTSEIEVGQTKQLFSNCGLTLIVKLNSLTKNVAYFDAYVGKILAAKQ